jgi:cysteine desulfurase
MAIYCDHAATTPLDPRVLEAMLPYFNETYGNPSSLHTPGQQARQGIDKARRAISKTLNCSTKELFFTSGGTESNNLALRGIAQNREHKGKHIITTQIEHESILEPLAQLEKEGFEVTYLPVDSEGFVKLETLEAALRADTILVSIMAANNEIGTIQPLAAISEILKKQENPPLFHTDACQAAGALPLDLDSWGVDLMTLNGSKIHGPKGIGLLYVKNGVQFAAQIRGGGQERKKRAGTENMPGIVGLATALWLAQEEREDNNEKVRLMRDQLWEGVQSELPDLVLNGSWEKRLPNNLNFTVKGVEGEILLMRLDMEGIYASAGSACTAGNAKPSHVLLALGVSKQDAYNAVRFSLGKGNTVEEVAEVVKVFVKVVREIRKESAVY